MQHVYITEREPAGGERLELRYVLKALDPDVEIYAVDIILIIRINIIRIIIFDHLKKSDVNLSSLLKSIYLFYLSISFVFIVLFFSFSGLSEFVARQDAIFIICENN